jgi:hypothetical protein
MTPGEFQRVKPYHDPLYLPSLVAKALSEAGFTGSFFRFQHQLHYEPLAHTENLPWPSYKHLPRGGYIYPPRLHITHQKLGTVTLTLPGATVLPLYKFFEWFHRDNRDFKTTNELVTLWARSHDIGLSPQAIALMVVSAMQTEVSAQSLSVPLLISSFSSRNLFLLTGLS